MHSRDSTAVCGLQLHPVAREKHCLEELILFNAMWNVTEITV